MDILNKINAVWQNVGLVQRVLLIAVFVAAVLTAGFGIHWASRPDMRLLYADMAPQQASKIVDKINEKGISYELRNGGSTIYVPKESVYQLRLDMAQEGLAGTEEGGYNLFDDEKIGVSPFVQNVNLKRAIEEELARSIQMIDGVVCARVHLVSSKQKVFSSGSEDTSASVVLKLRPGFQLDGVKVAAISHLVAGSVEGLDVEKVTVVDSSGRLLTGSAAQGISGAGGTVQDYKERVEKALSEKVEQMLSTALGPDRAKVRISAVVDTTSINLVTEFYDPSKKVVTKEQIQSNSESGPAKLDSEGQPTSSGSVKKDETISTEYVVGKTIEKKTDLPGEVKSLSVAAFVDLSIDDPNSDQGSESAQIMEVADVEDIIKNALGLKETDSLKVVNVKFNRPAQVEIEDAADFSGYIALAKQLSLGLTGICALLVFKMFAKSPKPVPPSAAAQLPSGESANDIARLGASEQISQTAAIRRQITTALKSNPEQAREVFAGWLQEGVTDR